MTGQTLCEVLFECSLVVCNTAKVDIDPIPSKYRASTIVIVIPIPLLMLILTLIHFLLIKVVYVFSCRRDYFLFTRVK